ncbi:hypothetical protein J7426_16555 [Tropicibacter sp. R16_0]|uniref:hypothetical protein n=1 Tax=Tropicibacter sp. R16_0 TaxID=2821102 RepID=UPI001ADD5111|nr:hypothetical protein [Tropicibacter sp. R16_0]MBO9451888.1 hypothetical protein [Tropicibacter sp. R16_0]
MSFYAGTVSVAVFLICFWVPSWETLSERKGHLAIKRFVAGAVAVAIGVISIQFVFEALELTYVGPGDRVFLVIAAMLCAMPLLAIRIAQLSVRERRLLSDGGEN